MIHNSAGRFTTLQRGSQLFKEINNLSRRFTTLQEIHNSTVRYTSLQKIHNSGESLFYRKIQNFSKKFTTGCTALQGDSQFYRDSQLYKRFTTLQGDSQPFQKVYNSTERFTTLR